MGVRRHGLGAAGVLVGLLLVVASATPAVAAAPTRLWLKRYGGGDSDNASVLRVSPDGSQVVVAGTTNMDTSDYTTVAYDAATGARRWAARFDGGGHDYLDSAAIRPDGSLVFVTGEAYDAGTGATNSDYATVAYNAVTGQRVWLSRYSAPPPPGQSSNGRDAAMSLAVSPDGARVFVTGLSVNANGYGDFATVAYDAANGARLWVARYNDGVKTGGYGAAVRVSPDGTKVFVTGATTNATLTHDYATVAYEASTGNKLWRARYDGGDEDYASSLAVSPSGGRVFVTGWTTTAGYTADYMTLAYDASTGAKAWAARYRGPEGGYDRPVVNDEAVQVAPDGSKLFVTGESWTAAGDAADATTVAYAASTGRRLWEARYHGPTADASGFGRALAVSPDSSAVFVTAESWSAGNVVATTIDYDAAAGTRRWVARYDGAGYVDAGAAIGVSPEGTRVFVAGRSDASGSLDYLTIAYSLA